MPNRFEQVITANGMKIVEKSTSPNGLEIIEAEISTARGILSITCGSNGCAKICKPNGTSKWVYNKSYSQMNAIIKQTIEANNF